jgi:hypothetical protein
MLLCKASSRCYSWLIWLVKENVARQQIAFNKPDAFLLRALFLKVNQLRCVADDIDEGFEPEPQCKPNSSTPASSASFSF